MLSTADGTNRLRVGYAGDDSFITCLHALLDRPDTDLIITLTAPDEHYTGTVRRLSKHAGATMITGAPGPAGWAEVDGADLDLLVSAAYGYRIPVADLTSVGTIINVHPSLLPDGRGPNPLPHIAGGRVDAAGVTIHLVDENFDTGPVLLQRRFDKLCDRPSLAELTLRAMAVAPILLNTVLDDLDRHLAEARPQPTGSYWPAIAAQETRVDLVTATQGELDAAIHRFAGQGLSLALCDGTELTVKSAHFAKSAHPFAPGRLLGRLRGDMLVSANGGLIRAVPFPDDPTGGDQTASGHTADGPMGEGLQRPPVVE